MMRNALVAAGLAAALIPTAARAQRETNVTGNTLLQICTARDGSLTRQCNAYIDGVSDAMAAYEHAANRSDAQTRVPMKVCVPPSTPVANMRQAVVTFIQRTQSARNIRAVDAVGLALSQAYPCQPGANG